MSKNGQLALMEEHLVDLYKAYNLKASTVRNDILLRAGGGKIFSCCFLKKTNKQPRVMVARLGVKYAGSESGRTRDWDPEERQLLQVYDMQKHDWRFINLPKVLWLKAGGDLVVYNHEQHEFRP